MSDLALQYKGDFFDLIIEKDDLKLDDGLQSAVIVSLFSDHRVVIDELNFPDTDRAGWWGDLFSEVDQDQIGSKLWLLIREKRTEVTRTRFIEYCKQALTWMTEDGVADSVSVDAQYPDDTKEGIELSIDIQKPQGKLTFKYKLNWNAEFARGI